MEHKGKMAQVDYRIKFHQLDTDEKRRVVEAFDRLTVMVTQAYHRGSDDRFAILSHHTAVRNYIIGEGVYYVPRWNRTDR